jgi:hypothetical protein
MKRMTGELAQDILRFAAQKAHATEAAPLKLANVELWIEDGQLIHFPTTAQWDVPAFNTALTMYLTTFSQELATLVSE